ncbi:MAG: MtrB/PioB family decaheme-associated outer membrane protein, partial [Halioglobus sp.]|nr:MtrB/PioB family decaheme-associated outer membrane protein [Halioglobus sp.]
MSTRHLIAVMSALLPVAAFGQEEGKAAATERYQNLAATNQPIVSTLDGAFSGRFQMGGAYTFDDNFMFGQYNGLSDESLTLIGDLRWQDFGEDEYWQASFSDLGLDTREGRLTWGRTDNMRLELGFDSQRQVRNDSGRTPFRGDYTQVLPQNWVSGINTQDFAALDGALRSFDRELERQELSAAFSMRLAERWRLRSNLRYEEKEGHSDVGAGIYINGASADAVLLRKPVDYKTTEFDLGLAFEGERLHLDGELAYSDFDNDKNVLTWQNPYANFGDTVAYPAGTGGLSIAPDNEQLRGRLVGHYVFSRSARFQFDGSYALATQDQDYLGYTVNNSLTVSEPLPASDLDGEVASGTFNGKLLLTPWSGFTAQLFYKLRDRDYDVDRDGYLYVRGDGADQPGAEQTVYNTAHDLTAQTGGIKASYRLPLRSRLTAEYAYEEVERTNAAVETTEEDRYSLTYRIQPLTNLSARARLLYADRAADTYNWDQSYFALLDTGFINATPDSQRYLNHPLLYQFTLANRERYEGGLDLSYLPAEQWHLTFNVLWRYDDYDQSRLGLTEAETIGGHASASYAAGETLTVTAYAGLDRYDGNQGSRTFRGGQEKNAFEIFPPLPQASDPDQNWELDATDHTVTLGANINWRPAQDYEVELDYSYVDTRAEQQLYTQAGNSDLPDVDTRLHHFTAAASWHVSSEMSLRLDYQYYDYESDDWSWQDVQADTLDKVLG